jgi:predicted O-methyltransferase YrrM
VESGDRFMRLVFCDAVGRLLRALQERQSLRTAYIGDQPEILIETEALSDFGFKQHAAPFFETARDDRMHLYQPLSSFDPALFDVILAGDIHQETALMARLRGCPTKVIPLRQWSSAFTETVRAGAARGYRTCLNPMKLALVSAAIGLAPANGSVLEAGVYMGGTTLFMFRLQRQLGIERPIFALDTYAGMPAPTQKDREDAPFVYEAGMFSDNRKDVVRRYFDSNGASSIRMVEGLVQDTIASVSRDRIAFMLLDCDQYSGTFGGLTGALPYLAEGGLIIVDDSEVVGVRRALEEISKQNPEFRRVPHISHNFDLIYRSDKGRAVDTPWSLS